MRTNDVRNFQILKSSNPHCRLTGGKADPNIVAFSIKKEKNIPDKPPRHRRFITHGVNYGKIDCQPGYIEHVDVEMIARGCGIAKILTRLCMGEDRIHKTTNNENGAMANLQNPRFSKIKECVKSTCAKIITLEMSAKDSGEDRASVFFKSSIASGFTNMFIMSGTVENPSNYPEEGSCSVEELQLRYDGNGYMLKDDNRVKVTGGDTSWYFCFPKLGPSTKCCTIM